MKRIQHLHLAWIGLCSLALATSVQADVVETRGGARLVGTVSSIDGTTVQLETDYAGTLAIKQSEVVAISTDNPRFYRLAGGTVLQGTVSTDTSGQLVIAGQEGSVSTPVGGLAATWGPTGEDPAVSALRRKWKYEAGIDISGKDGNSSQLGTAISGRAVLKTSQDALEFYTAYLREKSDGTKSADQFKLGVDYQNNFAGRTSWYMRAEGGFDRIKDIDLYTIAAAGLGYDFIKKPNQTLTGRAGLSYRYEGYGDPLADDVSSAGLDFGLKHELTRDNWAITNSLSYVPAFDDFGNYRVTHDSGFEMPIAASQWKLRIGIANDFTSEPPAGREELDTTYYTRLILNWE